jgi:nitroreductase
MPIRLTLEFFEVLSRRRSVRAYSSKPVEEDKLIRVFEAANMAPSAGNLQAYQVFVYRKEEKRKALARAAFNQAFVAQAPVCLVFCADSRRSAKKYAERGSSLYSVQDATIAGTYAMLAAANLGLATVWVGDFDEDKVREVVGDRNLRPVVMFAMGYAAEEPQPSERRDIEEIFRGDFPQTD